MTDYFTNPDCMMPDGAEPCKGYRQLYEKTKQLQEHIATLQELREFDRKDIARLRAEIESYKENRYGQAQIPQAADRGQGSA